MSIAIKNTKTRSDNVGELISAYRDAKALSQSQIAGKLGVSRVTIARWEKGNSAPSTLALKQLKQLVVDDAAFIKTLSLNEEVPAGKSVRATHKSRIGKIVASPYVLNGPKDQNNFHKTLIEMQQSLKVDKNRLSLVQTIDGEPTAQFLLEAPTSSALSWNSNYGPHGWHRYVGRFPPHLVRAILNHFEATPKDLICDPFSGSGTTLVETRLLGIPSVGVEICPLSCLITRAKTTFTSDTAKLNQLAAELDRFYTRKYQGFIKNRGAHYNHQDVILRKGNVIQTFPNIEKWFTSETLLGVSIVTEFATTKKGYEQDIILTALSAKMRSIGNVDVDVIRAEYSKKPRINVNVLRLVKNQLTKMVGDIESTISSHSKIIGDKSIVTIKQASILEVSIKKNSISHIITSPPYGVESLSYLRTHLLSYRTLKYFLKADPYDFGKRVIGSEYLSKEIPDVHNLPVSKISKTYVSFFNKINSEDKSKLHKIRIGMMMYFFQNMEGVVHRFNTWLKPGGKVAFVIGNKKIDGCIIPTDSIIAEIFMSQGFDLENVLNHKLKTNNSNSRVPWQDRIIEQEFVMIFQKKV